MKDDVNQNLYSVLMFDGVNDYIEIDDPFENYESFTLSLWVKPATLNDGSYHGIIGKQGDHRRKPSLWIAPKNNGLHYDSYDWSGQRYSHSLNNFFTQKSQWVHITWVKDKTEYKFYQNGQLLSTQPAPEKFYTTKSCYWFGRVDNYFMGEMADIRIWKIARSPEAIQSDMYKTLLGNETGLVGYWPLEENQGIIVRDITENGNHGQIYEATWKQAFIEVSDSEKKPSRPVLVFDSNEDYVEIQDPFKNQTTFTISLWVKPAVLNDGWFHGFLGKQGDRFRKPGLWLSPKNGGLHYDSYSSTGQRYNRILNHFFTAKNQWVHIAWVKQGTEYKIYRNGELFATEPAPEFFYTTDSPYWIGRVDTFFPGQIVDLKIWQIARSSAEIKADMWSRLTGNESGLVGYWPCNEGSGNIINDQTQYGNHGILHQITWEEDVIEIPPIPQREPKEIPQPKIKGEGFLIKSQLNGYVLDVAGGQNKPGTFVVIHPPHGEPHQRWTMTSEGVIQSQINKNLVLDFQTSEIGIYTMIVVNELQGQTGSPSQQWKIEDGLIKNKHDENLVLEILDAGTDIYTPIMANLPNDDLHQKWEIIDD